MKDILLVRPAGLPSDGSAPVLIPPLGLWSMQSNPGDWHVRVWDCGAQGLPEDQRCDVVGYSLLYPSHLAQLPALFDLLHAKLEIFGGPAGRGFDGWQAGDGESFLNRWPMPFSSLCAPTFPVGTLDPYWKAAQPFGPPTSRRWMTMETSRGCPNDCGFCTVGHYWGQWRGRSPAQIGCYLQYLREVHGVREIHITDDNAMASRGHFLDLIAELKRNGMYWSLPNGAFNRALLDSEILRALEGSRCTYMALPFEAGNAKSAELMNLRHKYLDFEDAQILCYHLNDLGIATGGQFIIGYPGETEEDVRATLQYANALPLSARHIHIATPLPFSPMWREALKRGWLKEEDVPGATYKTAVIDSPLLPRSRLQQLWQEDRDAALRRQGGTP